MATNWAANSFSSDASKGAWDNQVSRFKNRPGGNLGMAGGGGNNAPSTPGSGFAPLPEDSGYHSVAGTHGVSDRLGPGPDKSPLPYPNTKGPMVGDDMMFNADGSPYDGGGIDVYDAANPEPSPAYFDENAPMSGEDYDNYFNDPTVPAGGYNDQGQPFYGWAGIEGAAGWDEGPPTLFDNYFDDPSMSPDQVDYSPGYGAPPRPYPLGRDAARAPSYFQPRPPAAMRGQRQGGGGW